MIFMNYRLHWENSFQNIKINPKVSNYSRFTVPRSLCGLICPDGEWRGDPGAESPGHCEPEGEADRTGSAQDERVGLTAAILVADDLEYGKKDAD